MNVEYFIAKRLFTAKEKNNRYTKPILRIAILAIALSVAVMLLSVTVLTGFKNEISNKIIGFGSHITISNFTNNQSYESEPIALNQEFYPSITEQQGIKHIQTFATKAGIIKTKDEILGMVLKGIGSDFNPSFFEKNLIEGQVPIYNDTLTSNRVMISKSVADVLQLKLGEKLIMYFVEQPPRVRKFLIAGIYETGFADFDDLIIMADIRHIQKLNGWESNQVGGFEILIDNFEQLDEITAKVYEQIPYNLNAQSIKEKNPQLFDWLDLQDINVRVILILMLIVGGVNMITALLILILERTSLVGTLKALGASNWSVRKVFLYNGVYLILKGLFWGNIIGLGIAFLQKKFQFISLDSSIYYMDTVPINFNFMHILMLNVGTLLVCWLILIIPSIIITKITPIKAIRFA
jgi:lipoprotein-releasing system permease protein